MAVTPEAAGSSPVDPANYLQISRLSLRVLRPLKADGRGAPERIPLDDFPIRVNQLR